ncbi:MAG TPA: 2-C-methyl-D-erythritol 2,4-cyclodiphosphate synthase [Phycisphaerae bacterium]|nr:2-C-methyl-D-erythritol 2,4-cyclodiphosphate synthase [Phycisphaerae bacterium]
MTRVGLGYDSHRFEAGRPLVLGGVEIDHPMGLAGHSDGDAALHAVIDALLGAAGLADIGEQFPDTDPRWKDADSAELLKQTTAKLAEAGYRPVNCDVTILAEAPRLTHYKQQMRSRIGELLGLPVDAVSVKAKTNEQMGWIGRREGIAALAAALVERTG